MEVRGAEPDVRVRYDEAGDGTQWVLVDGDGERIAAGSEPCPDRAAATAAVDRVRRVAADATLRTFRDTTLVIHREEPAETPWLPLTEEAVVEETGRRLVDGTGAVLADLDGSAGTETGESMVVVDAEESDVTVLHGDEWVGGSGGEVLAAGRPVDGGRDAVEETMRVVEPATETDAVAEVDGPAFELFEDGDRYGWRLVDAAGDPVARSTGRYGGVDAVRSAVAAVRRWAAEAD
jgi:hypothetical protein